MIIKVKKEVTLEMVVPCRAWRALLIQQAMDSPCWRTMVNSRKCIGLIISAMGNNDKVSS